MQGFTFSHWGRYNRGPLLLAAMPPLHFDLEDSTFSHWVEYNREPLLLAAMPPLRFDCEVSDMPDFRRKKNRLDMELYSRPGVFFITVVTTDRKCLFWNFINGQGAGLSPWGTIVKDCISRIPEHFPGVIVDKFVIMPNHIHLLLRVEVEGLPLSKVIGVLKHNVTILIGRSIWQKGFYDHIIRSERDYQCKWEYIQGNPIRWQEDEIGYPEDLFSVGGETGY